MTSRGSLQRLESVTAPGDDAILRQGMVLTLEPGLYGVSTGGIRLEHNYLITEDGFRRLSNHKLSLN